MSAYKADDTIDWPGVVGFLAMCALVGVAFGLAAAAWL